MPYVVEVDNNMGDLKMPQLCPYCLSNEANSSIDVKYTKSFGGIPTPAIVLFLYQERMFRFPACGRCANSVSVLGRVAPLIAIIPVIAFMAIMFFQWPHLQEVLIFAIIGGVVAALMISYRQWKIMGFRVGYQNRESTLLYVRSRRYAYELASLNGLKPQYKLFVWRWW
jgi:hypothetical protein